MRGASKGEGLGNQFLGNIREVDAIVHVVRCFEDSDVTHVEGRIDPIADIETVETELMLADLDSLERRVDALEKKARGGDKEAKETLDLVNRALALLRDGKPARLIERKPEEERTFRMLGLLTAKPVLYVCNVDESAAATGNAYSRKVEERAKQEGAACVVISAKIEAEIAVLPPEERADYLAAIGLVGAGPRPADPRRLRAARSRHLLHRRSEGGARLDGDARRARRRRRPASSTPTSSAASSAPRPSATTTTSALGGEAGARDAGKLRLEGKDYVVADGDVMHFRFAT